MWLKNIIIKDIKFFEIKIAIQTNFIKFTRTWTVVSTKLELGKGLKLGRVYVTTFDLGLDDGVKFKDRRLFEIIIVVLFVTWCMWDKKVIEKVKKYIEIYGIFLSMSETSKELIKETISKLSVSSYALFVNILSILFFEYFLILHASIYLTKLFLTQ